MITRVSFSAVCAAALLAACGGGSSSDPPPPAPPPSAVAQVDPRMAKFVGHWVGCWATSANTTEHGDLQVVSLGDMKFKVTTDYVQYNGSSDCTGTPIPLFKEDSEATLVGETLVVEGITVEKITRTGQRTTYLDQTTHIHSVTAPVSPKGIAGVIDGATPTLRVGDDSVLDGQGYPSALWPMVYVKQPS